MKSFMILLTAIVGCSASAQSNEHPIVHHMVAKSDVVAVARVLEPQIWVSSELILLTGNSTAKVERTLKGEKMPEKIEFQVVRHLEIGVEKPELPNQGKDFPITPTMPKKFSNNDDTTRLENADKVFVFLRRSEKGLLSAVDGFLYTLPYTPELEKIIAAAVKKD